MTRVKRALTIAARAVGYILVGLFILVASAVNRLRRIGR